MLFRRELAPGAAEQVAAMEQEGRRRQIEQQLALHQVLRRAVMRSHIPLLLHDTHQHADLSFWGLLLLIVFLIDRRGFNSNSSSNNSSRCFPLRCKCSSTDAQSQELVIGETHVIMNL